VLVPVASGAEDSSVEDVTLGRLDGPWLVDGGSVTVPHRWEDDPARASYSGSASYQIEIELPETDGQVLLDFGNGSPAERSAYLPEHSYQALLVPPIGVAAEVWLNDTRCGTLWAPPYRVDLAASISRTSTTRPTS
jgi:hypothetical protein